MVVLGVMRERKLSSFSKISFVINKISFSIPAIVSPDSTCPTPSSSTLIFGNSVNILSMSKSPPVLPTISAGSIMMLPADSGKNSAISINSIEFNPWVGILTATDVMSFLLSFNHSSSLMSMFNAANSDISSSLAKSFTSFNVKSSLNLPCIATFICIACVFPSLRL